MYMSPVHACTQNVICMLNRLYIVWCRVLTDTSKKYVVSSKHLENIESGEPLSNRDLLIENTVLWRSRGKVYQVVILEIHSKFVYVYTVHNST